MGSVCVSPGMLETKVMVAPNSPNERANPSTAPAKMPGRLKGKVTVQNTRNGLAPKSARRALQPPVHRLDRQAHRPHHKGQRHDRGWGRRRAGPAEHEGETQMIAIRN